MIRKKVFDHRYGRRVPAEARDFIFEKFAQVNSSNSRVYEGAGLGLYIAKKFTEMLQGTITVEGELNRESSFTVTLPMACAVREIRDPFPGYNVKLRVSHAP